MRLPAACEPCPVRADLAERNGRLMRGLLNYGHHTSECRGANSCFEEPCDCGLDAVLLDEERG